MHGWYGEDMSTQTLTTVNVQYSTTLGRQRSRAANAVAAVHPVGRSCGYRGDSTKTSAAFYRCI